MVSHVAVAGLHPVPLLQQPAQHARQPAGLVGKLPGVAHQHGQQRGQFARCRVPFAAHVGLAQRQFRVGDDVPQAVRPSHAPARAGLIGAELVPGAAWQFKLKRATPDQAAEHGQFAFHGETSRPLARPTRIRAAQPAATRPRPPPRGATENTAICASD